MNPNPYTAFVELVLGGLQMATNIPLGNSTFQRSRRPTVSQPGIPKTSLLIKAHPDDESMDPLSLRLQSLGSDVHLICATYGSKVKERPRRLSELRNACAYLGYNLVLPHGYSDEKDLALLGFSHAVPATKSGDLDAWRVMVNSLKTDIGRLQPDCIIVHHDQDWNKTHEGVSALVSDALDLMPMDFQPHVFFTEYWRSMQDPNFMMEVSPEELSTMMYAISLHAEEVRRNPYHLSLIAHLLDSARRGPEVVGGQGGLSKGMVLAKLFSHHVRSGGKLIKYPARMIGCDDDFSKVFASADPSC